MNIGNYIAEFANSEFLPGWLIAVILFAAVVAMGLVAQFIVMRVLERLFARSHPVLHRAFVSTRGLVRFGFVILAVAIALPLMPLPTETLEVAHNFLLAALVVLIGWVFLTITNFSSERYVRRVQARSAKDFDWRKATTQIRILRRAIDTLIILVTIGCALMMFQSVRQFGMSLFASAGVAGIVIGLAARPVLENLFAGVQLAITQPVKIDDAVVVEGQWGEVEEFNSTYTVIRLWDRRRLILPLNYFLEKPFENWTRVNASLIGSVMLYLDYTVPVDRVRAKAMEIAKASKLWDGDVVNVQVTEAKQDGIEIRILVSAANPSASWDLRCEMREKLLAYIQSNLPWALPRRRNVTDVPELDDRGENPKQLAS